jgi:hypothetical protein
MWDPGRYLPDRAEDKKVPCGFLGWGVGKHTCPKSGPFYLLFQKLILVWAGMRLAKLEITLLTAMWIALFEYELVDEFGKRSSKLPMI